MTFGEFMSFMFDIQKKFPNMRWEIADECRHSTVKIILPVDTDTVTLLSQAKEMFS